MLVLQRMVLLARLGKAGRANLAFPLIHHRQPLLQVALLRLGFHPVIPLVLDDREHLEFHRRLQEPLIRLSLTWIEFRFPSYESRLECSLAE